MHSLRLKFITKLSKVSCIEAEFHKSEFFPPSPPLLLLVSERDIPGKERVRQVGSYKCQVRSKSLIVCLCQLEEHT